MGRHRVNLLDSVRKPLSGRSADRSEASDRREAEEAGLPPELWGMRTANGCYYRRPAKQRGTPLVPGTYPPVGDVEDTSSYLPSALVSQEAEVTRELSKEPGQPKASDQPTLSKLFVDQQNPRGGHGRRYGHGGVNPLMAPGILQRVRIGGERQAEGLMPMVNFGPKELLRIDFRSVEDPEACWQAAMEQSKNIKLKEPRHVSTRGNCWKDTGGSHETLDFDMSLLLEGLTIGRGEAGSLHKDCLDHTAMGKGRRDGNGGHTEVTEETIKQGYLDVMILFLYSMAAVSVEFFYPVMCMLVGARTKWHLDSFYGGCSNAARFADAGGFLVLDFRIPFRQCVVQFNERFFVPMTLGNKNGPVLRMLELLPDGTSDYDESFTREWLYSDEVSILGYLPYLVLQPCTNAEVAWADGRNSFKEKMPTHKHVGTVPDYNKWDPERTLVYEPSEATYFSSLKIIQAAKAMPERPAHMPASGMELCDHSDGWIIFRGWQYPHRFTGDPRVRRINMFSRALRQVPTGAAIKIRTKERTRKRSQGVRKSIAKGKARPGIQSISLRRSGPVGCCLRSGRKRVG